LAWGPLPSACDGVLEALDEAGLHPPELLAAVGVAGIGIGR
jgi:hypothetical protein